MDNKVLTELEVEELKQLFAAFDKDKDGRLSTEELLKLTKSMGEAATEEDILFVIRSFDTDGDDALNEGEYLDLMSKLRSLD
ncbi:calmodulin-like 3 [Podila clonocystis]|nr:calmodulin-like 3 [Podila clonocystis]